MKAKIWVILIMLVLGIFIIACEVQKEQNIKEDIEKGADRADEVYSELTKALCDKAGGRWNESGSPCTGTDAEFCIQVCQAQCECGGIAGFKCPQGYKCKLSGKIADEIGVCVKG